MKKYVELFKALADETRLRIMVLISEKELCVCQIESALGLPQAKVSRHLTVLRHAGLVKARREGLWAYYSLEEPRNDLEETLLKQFGSKLSKETGFQADRARMKKCADGA